MMVIMIMTELHITYRKPEWTKLPSLLHDRMEEAQAKEKLFELVWLAASFKEFRVGNRI